MHFILVCVFTSSSVSLKYFYWHNKNQYSNKRRTAGAALSNLSNLCAALQVRVNTVVQVFMPSLTELREVESLIKASSTLWRRNLKTQQSPLILIWSKLG